VSVFARFFMRLNGRKPSFCFSIRERRSRAGLLRILSSDTTFGVFFSFGRSSFLPAIPVTLSLSFTNRCLESRHWPRGSAFSFPPVLGLRLTSPRLRFYLILRFFIFLSSACRRPILHAPLILVPLFRRARLTLPPPPPLKG